MNGRCPMHGCHAVSCPAVGTYNLGRYSNYLPAHLMDRYQSALADTELIVMREELALLDALTNEVRG